MDIFTKDEIARLLEYIEFMAEFDDDPSFRDHALSAKPKLEKMLEEINNQKE